MLWFWWRGLRCVRCQKLYYWGPNFYSIRYCRTCGGRVGPDKYGRGAGDITDNSERACWGLPRLEVHHRRRQSRPIPWLLAIAFILAAICIIIAAAFVP